MYSYLQTDPTWPIHVNGPYPHCDSADIDQTDGCANLQRIDPWVIRSPLIEQACIYIEAIGPDFFFFSFFSRFDILVDGYNSLDRNLIH